MPAEWLGDLERSLATETGHEHLAVAIVVVAAVAGRHVPVDEGEAHAAARRALFLLAAGGDPSRGLDLNGRAVAAVAAELDRPDRRAALARGIDELRGEAAGLAHMSEAIHALLAEPEIAWRAYACSLLAEELSEE